MSKEKGVRERTVLRGRRECPAPWAQKGYSWITARVFAATPNRIFIAARGELKLPETLLPRFNGTWIAQSARKTEPKPEMAGNCLLIVDGHREAGRVVDAVGRAVRGRDAAGRQQIRNHP